MTVNVAVLPEETKRAVELVRQARRGVDAFIVQDLGIAAEVKRVLPEARLHVSTQMNTHGVDGVRAAARIGADRVTLARELTLLEVAEASAAAHECGMSAECFGHGALCICYSGQCFMSSLIGGRSANRGMCAQACRLPYSLHNASVKNALPSEGDHLLSPKDLCSIDMLIELGATGVDSLKIEGRMKSPEYVFSVVGVYRRVLDRLADAADGLCCEDEVELAQQLRASHVGPTEDERRILTEAFSRGFTEGYLKGRRGNEIMSYGRPNNRGVFVGRVSDVRNGTVSLSSEIELHEGDLLEFWTNKGICLHAFNFSRRVGMALPRRKARQQRRWVFRVRDASMAFDDDAMEPRLPVNAKAFLRIGEPSSSRRLARRRRFASKGRSSSRPGRRR
ncbi:MAG: peptidase U32 family protein [Slackia sp.]